MADVTHTSVGNQPKSFGPALNIETADILMRQTDQYAQWQLASQNNDIDKHVLAEKIIARNEFLQKYKTGEPVNWKNFDDLTKHLGNAGLAFSDDQYVKNAENKISGTPVLHSPPLSSPVTSASPTASADVLLDENTLILDLKIPDISFNETILGYSANEKIYLPLGQISNALGFNISVEPQAGTAQGWYITDDRSFSLDINATSTVVDGKTIDWNPHQVIAGEDDIYVEASVLSQLLPIDFEFSLGELYATVTPRETLPLQLQYQREQKRLDLLNQEDNELKYEAQQAPYELFSFPFVDASITGRNESFSGDESSYQTNYSINAEGDLGYMGAKVYLAGNETEALSTARFRLNRSSPEADLLGPLKASSISIGDVSPTKIATLRTTQEERGLTFSNGELYTVKDFDSTRFEGNSSPGWDVELYRDNTLIDSQRVRSNGRYVFDDIPVFFGPNNFRVLAFGPQGQRRVLEEEQINVGPDMLIPGNFKYDLSATERKNNIFNIDQRNETDGEGRFNGKVSYGLTDNMSVMGGGSSVEFDNNRHNYLTTGISGFFSSFYGEANYVYDTASGSGISLTGKTALGSLKINATHESYYDFIEERQPSDPLQSRNILSLNGRTPEFGILPSLNYTLSTDYTTYTSRKRGTTSANLSGMFNRVNLSNNLRYNYVDSESSSNIIDGTFNATSSIRGGGRVTAGINYKLGSNNEISRYRLSGYKSLGSGLGIGSNLDHYVADEKNRTRGELSLDWDSGKYIFSPSVFYDTEQGAGAFFTLSFSLGYDEENNNLLLSSERKNGQGGAKALVYHDVNNNKIFDQGDSPISDVEIYANQAKKQAITDSDGIAYITGLNEYKPTDIEINIETLDDPFWHPSVPGAAVTPRSGKVNRVELPIVTTGEIDGTIYLVDAQKNRIPLSGAKIEILNDQGEVVQAVTSEYDGFYLFDKVLPGTYTLRVKSEELALASQPDSQELLVNIGNDGTIVSGNDIVLQGTQKDKQPIDPSTSDSRPTDTHLSPPMLSNVEEFEPTHHAGPITPTSIKRPISSSERTKILASTNHIEIVGTIDIKPGTNVESSQPINQVVPIERPVNEENAQSRIRVNPISIVASQPALASANSNNRQTPGTEDISSPTARTFSRVATQAHVVPGKPDIREPAGRPVSADPRPSMIVRTADHSGRNRLNDTTQYQRPNFIPIPNPIEPIINQIIGQRVVSSVPERSQEQKIPTDRVVSLVGDGRTKEVHQKTLAQQEAISEKKSPFTIHLASYTTQERAERGVAILSQRLQGLVSSNEISIEKVDLGPDKGIWFRVLCGQFQQKLDADKLAEQLLNQTDYAASIASNTTQPTQINIGPLKLEDDSGKGRQRALIAQKYATMQLRKNNAVTSSA